MALDVPPWLNEKFVEKALKHSEKDETITVMEITIKPATDKGDNYLSDMYRILVKYKRDRNNVKVTEKRSIIVKIALTTEGGHKEFTEKSGIFDIEINIMSSTLREMEGLLGDTKLGPQCLYVQREDPALLVMEDLVALGYRMANREEGLDLQHSLMAIRGLAKFHASSVAICEQKPELKEKYNAGLFRVNAPPEMPPFFVSGMKCLSNVVASWPGLDEECAEKIMKLSDVAYEKAAELSQVDESEFNVINHGDFWTNNMMFRYDDNKRPTHQTLCDFQLCVYGSPAIDLQYFLHTSSTEEVVINHTDDIMNEYLQVLSKTMRRLNCTTEPPSMDDLQCTMQKLEFYGMVIAATCMPLVLIKKDEAQSFEEIMGDDGSGMNNKAYTTPEYEIAMSRRLLHWNKMGLLDS